MPVVTSLTRAAPGPVLVLRALGLGDLLTSVPALRGIRRAVGTRPVVLAAPRTIATWIAELKLVDGWVETPSLRGRPPGIGLGPHDAVDLHGNGAPSRDLLAAGSPRTLASYAPPGAPGVRWNPDEHEVRRWCRLVEAIGGACDPADLRLAFPCRSRASRVGVLHPGASSGSRRWPVDRWARLARELTRQGAAVVVTAGPGERALAQDVVRRAGLPPSALVSGLDLAALAALVSSAAVVVCGDTGIGHLATALGVASVLLFGPVSPRIWGPLIDLDRHRVLFDGDGNGDPHAPRPDPALLRITVEQVVDAALQVASSTVRR